MKKLGILILTILFVLPFAVFAEGENTKQSTISYDTGSASYEWSIPQSFTFEKTQGLYNNEETYGATIPVTFSEVVLPEGMAYSVNVTSAHNFNLTNGNSSIPYGIGCGDGKLLFTESGTKNIYPYSTVSEILQATVAGVHSDTLTFNVSLGAINSFSENPEYCTIVH